MMLTEQDLDEMMEACLRVTGVSRHGVITYRLEKELGNAGEATLDQAHYERFVIEINPDLTVHPAEKAEEQKRPIKAALRTVLHECVHVMLAPTFLYHQSVKKMAHHSVHDAIDAMHEFSDETCTVRVTDALMPQAWSEYQKIKKTRSKTNE
ncbi:hypothetical protein Dxin01_00195 [Deinococcus xinjiangensis]|uniref:SprT-like domain-containing protein n=1 Tax=Deinococcus xinjiangensis TaxID=457454 RepID=A0ABP9V5I3_9DEIO